MQIRMILTQQHFVLVPTRGKPVRLAVSGPRQNHWANAVLMLPALMQRLADLGVTHIHLPGSPDPTRVSAAYFCLMQEKGDAELEQARQQALSIAANAISITSDDVVVDDISAISFGGDETGNETGDTGAFA